LVKGEITPRYESKRSLRYALKLGETLEALRRMATRDQLTGLLNRREFERVLNEEDERRAGFKQSFALGWWTSSFQVGQRHARALRGRRGAAEVRGVCRRGADGRSRVPFRGREELALLLVQTDAAGAFDSRAARLPCVERDPIHRERTIALKRDVSADSAAMPADADSGLSLLTRRTRTLRRKIRRPDRANSRSTRCSRSR